MLTRLLFLALLVVPAAPLAAQADGKKAVKALVAWTKDYLRGKYDVGNNIKNIAGKSLAKKAGLVPDDRFKDRGALKPGQFSYDEECELLTELAGKANTEAAAKALLGLAVVGLDRSIKLKATMVPVAVREQAEKNLALITNSDARKFLKNAADGNIKAAKKRKLALQAAAIRALGAYQDKSYASTITKHLASKTPLLRLIAAEAAGLASLPSLFGPVVTAFEKEKDPTTRIAQFEAYLRIFNKARGKVDRKILNRFVKTAVDQLGRSSWRLDMVMLPSLNRETTAVPKFIAILDSFQNKPTALAKGLVSGVQRHEAYRVLKELSSQEHGIHEIDKWRGWWDSVKGNFKPKSVRIADANQNAKTGFFGVAPQGSRVVFVVDTSRKMGEQVDFVSREKWGKLIQAASKKGKLKRVDAVRTMLQWTIDALPATTQFNIVRCDLKPKSWQKGGKLVPANDKNKKGVASFLKRLSPSQEWRPNCFDAMQPTLGISNYFGEAFKSKVDEVFLICNAPPSHQFGAIRDGSAFIRSIAEANRFSQARIHTFYVGAQSDPDDKNDNAKAVLKTLAEAGKGRFVQP